MSLGERILLALSRSPEAPDYHLSDDDVHVDNALDLLFEQFGPPILDRIKDKVVLDYGCGFGKQAVALLNHGAAHVHCVDIVPDNITQTRAMAEKHGVADRLSVELGDIHEVKLPAEHFDTAISTNSFEHFADPEGILRVCHPALKQDGRFVITFGDPWYHPFGSHMQYFTRMPWVHVLFSERTVMNVRARFRNDGAQHYGEVRGGLNQITVRRFGELARRSGYRMDLFQLHAIRHMDFLTRVPGVREFFTNRVNCLLAKDAAGTRRAA